MCVSVHIGDHSQISHMCSGTRQPLHPCPASVLPHTLSAPPHAPGEAELNVDTLAKRICCLLGSVSGNCPQFLQTSREGPVCDLEAVQCWCQEEGFPLSCPVQMVLVV